MTDTIISLDGVSFAYENAEATLHDVSLDIAPGECVVFMGASGSGKTTALRTINGLAGGYYKGTVTGTVLINGRDAASLPSWERAQMVGSVFQDPASQFFSAQLAGEIAFSCENLGMEQAEVIARTDGVIAHMGLDELRSRGIDSLSSGQKQKVAVASILAPRPTILTMDEPSSNLDEKASLDLGQTLRSLKGEGYTIVVAEHRIAYLLDIADRFIYVADGRIVKEMTREDVLALSESERDEMGIRSPVAVERPELAAPVAGEGTVARFEARDVSVAFKKLQVLDGVSLVADAGQIVALTGDNGVGKTTFARAATGLLKTKGGSFAVEGRALKRKELRREIWYSPNDTSTEFFTDSVGNEVMLLQEMTEERKDYARHVLDMLGLLEKKDQHPVTLSGGQKQRLSIACGIISGRRVLILDEPTSGLDKVSMNKMVAALRFAAAEGMAIIVITHDNEFIRAVATHRVDIG